MSDWMLGDSDSLLSVRNLAVEFDTYGGTVKAVRGVSFDVQKGRTLAIVGESGCGKSVSVQSVMGLIPVPPGRVTSGSVKLEGRELLGKSQKALNSVRGREIGMIFQDPMTSLNPTMTVGKQIVETLRVHEGFSGERARARAIELMESVHIPEAKSRADHYPFQFSGVMRQLVMIAMSIACNPKILIADEPTTALDVTIQAQILFLLKELQRNLQMSIILITHDLGVVERMADTVAVMYAGKIVEQGSVDSIYYRPSHPYTIGLRSAMPETSESVKKKLQPIEGAPPDLFHPPRGCSYFDRCPYAMQICERLDPDLLNLAESTGTEVHLSRCFLHHKDAPPSPVRRGGHGG